MNILE